MASATVLTAFATRLATWSSASDYPAMEINEAASSPAEAFTEIECPISTEEREEMGPPPVTYRETGVIALTLHVRKLAGVSAALTAVEALRDLFRDTEFDGVTTYEVAPPAFDKNNRRGVWYVVPVEVPYYFDYIKG